MTQEVDDMFAEADAEDEADLAEAEREAAAAGKEPFSYAQLEELLGAEPPEIEKLIFRVGGRSFTTSEKLWELLTQGAHYRLYCVADQLLSFAPGSAESGSAASRRMATEALGMLHT